MWGFHFVTTFWQLVRGTEYEARSVGSIWCLIGQAPPGLNSPMSGVSDNGVRTRRSSSAVLRPLQSRFSSLCKEEDLFPTLCHRVLLYLAFPPPQPRPSCTPSPMGYCTPVRGVCCQTTECIVHRKDSERYLHTHTHTHIRRQAHNLDRTEDPQC